MQKPSGYPKEIFRELNPKFVCAYCRLVLKNPMQSICGHRFCKDCVDYIFWHENSRICPSCTAEGGAFEDSCLTVEQTFPDNAIKREFNSMKAACAFEGCVWSGPFKDYEKHYATCEHRELECQCGAKYTPNQQRHHLENECPFREVNCSYCSVSVLFKDLDEHCMRSPLCPGHRMLCNATFPSAENRSSVASASGGETQTSASAAEPRIQSLIMEKQDVCERVITVLNREAEKLTLKMDSAQRERRQKTEQLDAMDRKVKSLERALAMKDATISELNIRLNALEQTSHDGTLLWRIDDFARKRQEAISGRTTSIYSPPFYTSKTGYKMCVRLFLNGDRNAVGTHISVSFVILRGQYDALLKWPFRGKVTITLLDQRGVEHVVHSFVSNPTSRSFRRPINQMNDDIGSNHPEFMEVVQLYNSAAVYIRDNTVFLKVVVCLDDGSNSDNQQNSIENLPRDDI